MVQVSESDGFDPRWQGAVINAGDWHFHRRLLERYGIVLAPGEFNAMRSAIRNGSALTLKVRKHASTIYSVRVESAGRSVFVLADKGGRLFTAVPPHADHYRLKKVARRMAKQDAANLTT